MGGVGGVANLGGAPPLNSEYAITLFGKAMGLFGQGLFPDAQRRPSWFGSKHQECVGPGLVSLQSRLCGSSVRTKSRSCRRTRIVMQQGTLPIEVVLNSAVGATQR